jgi:hypothetical protein
MWLYTVEYQYGFLDVDEWMKRYNKLYNKRENQVHHSNVSILVYDFYYR